MFLRNYIIFELSRFKNNEINNFYMYMAIYSLNNYFVCFTYHSWRSMEWDSLRPKGSYYYLIFQKM